LCVLKIRFKRCDAISFSSSQDFFSAQRADSAPPGRQKFFSQNGRFAPSRETESIKIERIGQK
jgi:hypothetical protein